MDSDALRAWLLAARAPDGSWGYAPGEDGVPEATLHAVAAGLPAPLAWLRDRDLGWSTWFAPAALAAIPEAQDVSAAAVDRTLASRGLPIEKPVGDFDGTIPGWTWVPDTFSWVEPTAWAVIGLTRAGHRAHDRVADGLRLLRDRQGKDGGWNYGNPEVLGADLMAYPHTTALVLLALPPGLDANAAWTWLLPAVEALPSALNLSLTALAARAHGRDARPFQDALSARQRPDGALTGRPHIDALALLASGEGAHPYAIHG
jgi:hypothetical protein